MKDVVFMCVERRCAAHIEMQGRYTEEGMRRRQVEGNEVKFKKTKVLCIGQDRLDEINGIVSRNDKRR